MDDGGFPVVGATRGMVVSAHHLAEAGRKIPFGKQRPAHQRVVEAEHGGFGLGQRQAFDAGEQHGPPGCGRDLAQDDELSEIVEQPAHEQPIRGQTRAGGGKIRGVDAAGRGMAPEGPHVAQLRRDVRKGLAGGQPHDQGGQFLLAHHGDGPADGFHVGGHAVDGAVDQSEELGRQTRVVLDHGGDAGRCAVG